MSMMTNFPTVHNATVVGELPVDAVLSLTLADHEHIYQGDTRLKIKRLKQFAIHGCKCYNCGREGNRILITIQKDKQHHVDLYHVDGDKAIMMNRDHILPASKGGGNEVWNMRPACSKCNGARGNAMEQKDHELAKFNRRWAQWHQTMFLPNTKIRFWLSKNIPVKTQYKLSRLVTKLLGRGPRHSVKA